MCYVSKSQTFKQNASCFTGNKYPRGYSEGKHLLKSKKDCQREAIREPRKHAQSDANSKVNRPPPKKIKSFLQAKAKLIICSSLNKLEGGSQPKNSEMDTV